MKLKFDKNLEYQHQAIASIVDLFRGQTPMQTNFTVSAYNGQIGIFDTENGIGNRLELDEEEINEIVLRIGVRSHDYSSVERFGKEIAPLILTGPPSVTGFAGGRPKPSEVVAYWPALIDNKFVKPIITIMEL
jgi:hypothetical protein